MAAGLYKNNNLSEKGLNATDALQKLYSPQVERDIILFAFADRLESTIYSENSLFDGQIYGLVNEPIADSSGGISLRTRFITQEKVPNTENEYRRVFTLSDDNSVWFEKFSPELDKRTSSETEGAPIRVSTGEYLVSVSMPGVGENYSVKDSSGSDVTLPAEVSVRLRGVDSGADTALARVKVKADGTLDRVFGVSILSGGVGYAFGETLELVLSCREEDDPAEDKCFRYTGNSLYQEYYKNGSVSVKALLKSDIYKYRVRYADEFGFVLYDDITSKYVYLGSEYDTTRKIEEAPEALVILKRKDSLSSLNLAQLYNLNGRSSFFGYGDYYSTGQSISKVINSLSESVEEYRNQFKYLVQNARTPITEFDPSNDLGTEYNIVYGKDINSDYKIVFRDPDGVLDQTVYSKTGTYTQSSTTITVNLINHSLNGGDKVYLQFSTGESVSGRYTIDTVADDSFNVTSTQSKTTSGNVSIFKGVSFFDLSGITQPNATTLRGQKIPGVWLWTGDKYSRVFSTDDQAFINVFGNSYLSPAISSQDGNELPESGSNKYSISASFTKPGSSQAKGYDVTLSSIVQNISSSSRNGGFVFHRTLSPSDVNGTVKAWPLFSYRESGTVKDAQILAI